MKNGSIERNVEKYRSHSPSRWALENLSSIATNSMYCHQKLKLAFVSFSWIKLVSISWNWLCSASRSVRPSYHDFPGLWHGEFLLEKLDHVFWNSLSYVETAARGPEMWVYGFEHFFFCKACQTSLAHTWDQGGHFQPMRRLYRSFHMLTNDFEEV